MRVKTYLISVHIAGWLLFMAFPILFLNGGEQSAKAFLLLASPYYWLFCGTYIILFYANAYYFIPWFFLNKQYIKYALVAILLFAGVYFLQPYDKLLRNNQGHNNFFMQQGPPMMHRPQNGQMPPPPGGSFSPGNETGRRHPDGPPQFPNPHNADQGPGNPGLGPPIHFVDNISLFLFLVIIALSTATRIVQEWQATEQRASRAEADKASAELSFLKAQINPHFLFNTLNNIYTLAVIKDDNAPDSIMKLSNIMRYVTDDAVEDFVPLQNELDCINDYIELQRLRLGEKTIVDISVSGNVEQKRIAPLILMTFIENVFKYGVSKHEKSVIIITIIATEGCIIFYCQNNIFSENNQHERTGIGIKNTVRRLEHLYQGTYLLNIRNENGMYTVNLTLNA